MLALRAVLTERGFVQPYWDGVTPGRSGVGHLYPEYLNIYADRGNIAVLARRAALWGTSSRSSPSGWASVSDPECTTFSTSGSVAREQALDGAGSRGQGLRSERRRRGMALLAVCGGYQLLGRGYRGRDGSLMPGAGLFGHETVAGSTRMIGDVLLDCEPSQVLHATAGFENHAGRTVLDADASALGRVVHGFGNDGESGLRAAAARRAIGIVPPRAAATSKNPWLADWPLAQALDMRSRADPPRLEPLPDELEAEAFRVAAGRARTRGGRQRHS